jgi:hypothetical protein
MNNSLNSISKVNRDLTCCSTCGMRRTSRATRPSMSSDSAQLAGFIGDMARQMAILANDPSLSVLRYLLHQVVEEAETLRNPDTTQEQRE